MGVAGYILYMYISTVYSIPPLLTSTPADSQHSETVSGNDASDTILSQKVYGELVVTYRMAGNFGGEFILADWQF